MYFRLKCIISDFSLAEGEVLRFNVNNTHLVKIKIRRPKKEEQTINRSAYNIYCSATIQAKVSDKNKEVFKKIEKNEVKVIQSTSSIKYTDNKGETIVIPGEEDFPKHFTDMMNQTKQELLDSLKLVIDAMRWRTNNLGSHNPIKNLNLHWSRDKKFWHPAPCSISAIIMDGPSRTPIPENVTKDIEHFVNKGIQEPVYHELFREAWELRNRNPRSSLIIGMSSLEVAIKETISNLIPDSSWLVDNLPSPPVVKLLNEYIPKLPTKKKIKKNVVPPPKNIIELIKKGVFIRNKIAHLGGKTPDNETLKQILEAIRDVIWSLECYSGHEWAYDFISDDTRLTLEEQ